MKRIVYPIILFAILQIAVISAITLWSFRYVIEKRRYESVMQLAQPAPSAAVSTTGYAALVFGLILLTFILVGSTLIFVGWIRERLLHKQRAEFFSSFSHELMTPITTIRMNMETLLANPATLDAARREKLVQAALAESMRLETTIKRIIETTRYEHKKLRLEISVTDLGGFLGEFTASARLAFPDAAIHYAGGAGIIARIDRGYFAAALTNIIQNAVKYSPEEKELEIRLAGTGAKAVIEIADHGIGIEKKQLKNIFQSFFRGSSGRAQGTGLGLFLTRIIVRLHHGTIRAESEGPGKGALFIVTLPIADTGRPEALKK